MQMNTIKVVVEGGEANKLDVKNAAQRLFDNMAVQGFKSDIEVVGLISELLRGCGADVSSDRWNSVRSEAAKKTCDTCRESCLCDAYDPVGACNGWKSKE